MEFSVGMILEALTPLIVYGVTALFRKISPWLENNSVATIALVALLSGVVPVVTNLFEGSGELSFLVQFGYGLLSIVLSQVYRALTGGNEAYHQRKLNK